MKKIISITLIIFLLNVNFAYAENWVTITAANGKSADLDLDSIQMAVDTVEYNIRTQNNDSIFINKMSTELYKEGIPTAVIERSKYKNGLSENNKISDEKINTRDYRILKSGTLQSEIFDVLSKELDKKNFIQGKKTWNKYLKKQRKEIYKHWKPHNNYWNTYSNSTSPVYFDDVLLVVDKNGVIQSKQHDRRSIQELSAIDPLPEDYTADTFQIDVKMDYYKYAGAKLNTKKPVVKQISPVRSEITISKNKKPPVLGHVQLFLLWCYKKLENFTIPDPPDNGLLCLIGFPFVITGVLCGFTGQIVSWILCFISGVDMDDL